LWCGQDPPPVERSSPSALDSQELRYRRRGARRAVGLHRAVVDLAADLLGDRNGDLLGPVESDGAALAAERLAEMLA